MQPILNDQPTIICPACGGSCQIEIDGASPWHRTRMIECEACEGEGRVIPDDEDHTDAKGDTWDVIYYPDAELPNWQRTAWIGCHHDGREVYGPNPDAVREAIDLAVAA